MAFSQNAVLRGNFWELLQEGFLEARSRCSFGCWTMLLSKAARCLQTWFEVDIKKMVLNFGILLGTW